MVRIYCVIACYNNYKWIDTCLRSLLASSIPVNIIVVDDLSTDGSPEMIQENYPEVDLILSESNNGFSVANNVGIEKAISADAEYIFLLNMDARIEPDTIKTLVFIAEKNSDFGIISPMHVNDAGTALDFPFSTYIVPQKCPSLYSDLYLKKPKEIYPVERINAAAWFVKTEVFKKVGLFDTDLPMYGSDDNLADRVRYYGLQVGVAPGARIYHDREFRSYEKKDVKNDLSAQRTRMRVTVLNPNLSAGSKLSLLIRKSMSDFLRNLEKANISGMFGNLRILFTGFFYLINNADRYKK